MMLFSFSIFSDRRSLKIENENNNTKTLTPKVSYKGLDFRFIYKLALAGWNYPWLELIFIVPKVFQLLKFYSTYTLKYVLKN